MYLCPTGSASCDPNACVVNNNIIRAFIFVFLLTMHGGVACSSYIRSWIYTVDRCLLLSICSIQKYAHDRYVSFMSLVSITLLFDHTFIQIRLRLVNLSHESRAILKWTFRASEISRNIWRSSWNWIFPSLVSSHSLQAHSIHTFAHRYEYTLTPYHANK